MHASGWRLSEAQLLELVGPAAVFGIALALILVARQLLLRWLKRRGGGKSLATVVRETIWLPSILWSLAGALEFALMYADLSARQVRWADNAIGAFVIISLTLVAMSVAGRTMTAYGERQGMPLAAAGLPRTLTRVVIVILGAMALLSNFHKEITPLLTALGVGGIAVALALQDTLANFFAGIHILVERPISVGDSIRLENGQEGTVSDIGWRTTRVRTGTNDTIVIPNTKITSGILVNFNLPDPRAVVEIAVLVAQEADADEVARLSIEEAAQVKGILDAPAPVCLCDPGMTPTHLQLKLLVGVGTRAQLGQVQSELRLRLLRRFKREGVPLPKTALSNAAYRS
jgi:small-conductance mechanosensitive channel